MTILSYRHYIVLYSWNVLKIRFYVNKSYQYEVVIWKTKNTIVGTVPQFKRKIVEKETKSKTHTHNVYMTGHFDGLYRHNKKKGCQSSFPTNPHTLPGVAIKHSILEIYT